MIRDRLMPSAATVGAMGLALAAVGLPAPLDLCLGPAGISSAAPSPSCGGDLRECLRQSADMRQTTFGGRYVTAEDVARCMEAFNSCIHGGGARGGNQAPPVATSRAGSGGSNALPQRFGMNFSAYGSTLESDCRVNGDKVDCTATVQPLPPDIVDYEANFTGTLSGMTVTGTQTSRQEVHYETGCISHEDYSTPYTFAFEPGGSVTAKVGVGQRRSVFTCSEPTAGTTPAGDITGTWSQIG